MDYLNINWGQFFEKNTQHSENNMDNTNTNNSDDTYSPLYDNSGWCNRFN